MDFSVRMKNMECFPLRLCTIPQDCVWFFFFHFSLWLTFIFLLTNITPFTKSPCQTTAAQGWLSFSSLNQWSGLPRLWWRWSTTCCSRRPREHGGSWARASSWGPPPCCWTLWSKGPSSWLITCWRRTLCKRTPTTSVSRRFNHYLHMSVSLLYGWIRLDQACQSSTFWKHMC